MDSNFIQEKISSKTDNDVFKNYEEILKKAVNDFTEEERNVNNNSCTFSLEYFSNYEGTFLDVVSNKSQSTLNFYYDRLPSECDINLITNKSIENEEEKIKDLVKQASFEIEIVSNSSSSQDCYSFSSLTPTEKHLLSDGINNDSLNQFNFDKSEKNCGQNLDNFQLEVKNQTVKHSKKNIYKNKATLKKYFDVVKNYRQSARRSTEFSDNLGNLNEPRRTSFSKKSTGLEAKVLIKSNFNKMNQTVHLEDLDFFSFSQSEVSEKLLDSSKSEKLYKPKRNNTLLDNIPVRGDICPEKSVVLNENESKTSTFPFDIYFCSDYNSVNVEGLNKNLSQKPNFDILTQPEQTDYFEKQLNDIIKITALPEVDSRLQQGLKRIIEDETLTTNCFNEKIPRSKNKQIILSQIDNLFCKILINFTETKSRPLIKVRSLKWNNCKFIENRLKLNSKEESEHILIKYRNNTSQNNFNLIVYLLGKVYSLLNTNCFCTKREIYYQIVNCIDSQEKVDNAINTISCLLEVPPWDLGILTSSKGLAYGDLKISLASNDVIHFSSRGGTLIPQNPIEINEVETDASFILVVEKDSVFQKLLDEEISKKLKSSFILVTGKGYPDINTRLFLKMLWLKLSKPVFILTDADPDGIDIMLTYRFGSLNSSHLSDYLALPNMKWLGIHPSEIVSFNMKGQTLSQKDYKKVKSLLTRPYFCENLNNSIKEEIEKLEEKKLKAEIEGIMKTDNFMSDVYLPNKLFTQGFI